MNRVVFIWSEYQTVMKYFMMNKNKDGTVGKGKLWYIKNGVVSNARRERAERERKANDLDDLVKSVVTEAFRNSSSINQVRLDDHNNDDGILVSDDGNNWVSTVDAVGEPATTPRNVDFPKNQRNKNSRNTNLTWIYLII